MIGRGGSLAVAPSAGGLTRKCEAFSAVDVSRQCFWSQARFAGAECDRNSSGKAAG